MRDRRCGEALRRSDYDALKLEIDALAAVESLKALTSMSETPRCPRWACGSGATKDSERSARRQVEALGVADFVDFVAGCDTGHGRKRDPDDSAACANHHSRPFPA